MGNRAGSIPVIRTKNKLQTLDGQRVGLICINMIELSDSFYCRMSLRTFGRLRIFGNMGFTNGLNFYAKYVILLKYIIFMSR